MAVETGSNGPVIVAVRRSRLTPDRERELFEAVITLVREVGYDAMTMDSVAQRARMGKATLYRQWQSKPRLLVAAMRSLRPVQIEAIDTGSLAGDLYELAEQLGAGIAEDTEFLTAIGHAMHRDPVLGSAIREILIDPEVDALRAVVDRAAARGELRDETAAREFLGHLLLGALPARKIIEDRFVDTEYLKRLIQAVVLPALRNS